MVRIKIGLFGGTFDPVHIGHLAVADTVRTKLDLQKVLFIPAGQPWLKGDREITPAELRLQMVTLAIAGKPYFDVSAIETERPGATYTVDTLTEMLKSIGDVEIYVIIGSDSMEAFPRWKEPARLLEMGYLVTVPRPGYPLPDLKAMYRQVPGLKERLIMLDAPEIDISASDIRQRVKEKLPFEDLVPAQVAVYIIKHKLYA